MGILLILLQVALVVLQFAAHVINVNLWLLFTPAIAFGTLVLIGHLYRATFIIDSFKNIYVPRRRR